MFRRAEPYFYAFDLLWLNGEDLRGLPLLQRKRRLRKLIGRRHSRLLYLDHLETNGSGLFRKACELDLEGIVAKRKTAAYRAMVKPYWIKIKNPRYSQAAGPEEQEAADIKGDLLFENGSLGIGRGPLCVRLLHHLSHC